MIIKVPYALRDMHTKFRCDAQRTQCAENAICAKHLQRFRTR